MIEWWVTLIEEGLAWNSELLALLHPESNLMFIRKPHNGTTQMKAFEQYFHVILFIMLYKVVLTF